MKRIEHLGIAVKNLEESIPMYEALLNTTCYKREGVASEGVMTAFFQVGASKIELLEATNEDSPIAKFLAKNGPGFHHVAFEGKFFEFFDDCHLCFPFWFQGPVAPGDVERAAGIAHAFEAADNLTHDLWTLGVGKVQAIGNCQGLGTDS